MTYLVTIYTTHEPDFVLALLLVIASIIGFALGRLSKRK